MLTTTGSVGASPVKMRTLGAARAPEPRSANLDSEDAGPRAEAGDPRAVTAAASHLPDDTVRFMGASSFTVGDPTAPAAAASHLPDDTVRFTGASSFGPGRRPPGGWIGFTTLPPYYPPVYDDSMLTTSFIRDASALNAVCCQVTFRLV